MKTVLPAAIIIAACTFIVVTCKWFKTNAVHQPFSIVGNWKIDSCYTAGKTIDSAQSLLSLLFTQTRKSALY